MKRIVPIVPAFIAVLLLHFGAGAALAHVTLQSASPAQDSSVEAVEAIRLEFSAPVRLHFVRVAVTGATQGPVEVSLSAQEGDASIVQALPEVPLQPDTFEVRWRVVADDGHRVEGTLSFTLQGQ